MGISFPSRLLLLYMCASVHVETTQSLGVVQGMSVPLVLGTPHSDAHVPIISGPRNFIQQKDGCRVLLLRRGKSVAPVATSTATPCDCSYNGTAQEQMAHQTIIEPQSKGYAKVETAFQGNGLFTQRQQVFERHRLLVAPGTMTCKTRESWWLEIIHTGMNNLRLPKGAFLGTIEAYEGNITVVTPGQWGQLLHDDATTVPEASSKPVGNRENDPPFSEENIPEYLRGRLRAPNPCGSIHTARVPEPDNSSASKWTRCVSWTCLNPAPASGPVRLFLCRSRMGPHAFASTIVNSTVERCVIRFRSQ